MTTKGLVHIYFGDGKGKTTAAIGLAVRCAGGGGKVLFFQFLKDGTSGEINVLKKIDGIDVVEGYSDIKFNSMMSETDREKAKEFYVNAFEEIIKRVNTEDYDLLILDEALHAVDMKYIEKEKMIDFIKNKPYGMELVLTGGKKADRELCAEADYVSDMLKIKHPFDLGVAARPLIEK